MRTHARTALSLAGWLARHGRARRRRRSHVTAAESRTQRARCPNARKTEIVSLVRMYTYPRHLHMLHMHRKQVERPSLVTMRLSRPNRSVVVGPSCSCRIHRKARR